MTDAASSTIDERTAYRLLSRARRRYLLYRLLETEAATIDDLARQIAAIEREAEATVDRKDEAARERVAASLHHAHVPPLEDCDLVEYDAAAGVVELAPDAPERFPFDRPLGRIVEPAAD